MAPFDANIDSMCKAFAGCSRSQMEGKLIEGVELEDKTTLALFIGDQETTEREWLNDYNARHPEAPITYPGQVMEKALAEEGIISFGKVLDAPFTKTLVSYTYDKEDKTLSKNGITLRVRHEEHKDPVTNEIIVSDPDISTKFQIDLDDTSSRFEYERRQALHKTENGHKFDLSILGIIEKEVSDRHRTQGAKAAMAWLEMFVKKVGFDFSDKREKTNINCRRTQPYAVMYTRKNSYGDLIRDNKTGKPKLYRPDNRLNEVQKAYGMSENRLVFMYCLDVNRFFAPHMKGVKIMKDHEWEHEHQDHECEYTPGSIASSEGVTREEMDAMDDYLKALKTKVMKENNIRKKPKLSGMNKDARGEYYLKQELPDHQLPKELTVRGETDNFVAQKIDGMKHLLEISPIVRAAHYSATMQARTLPSVKAA